MLPHPVLLSGYLAVTPFPYYCLATWQLPLPVLLATRPCYPSPYYWLLGRVTQLRTTVLPASFPPSRTIRPSVHGHNGHVSTAGVDEGTGWHGTAGKHGNGRNGRKWSDGIGMAANGQMDGPMAPRYGPMTPIYCTIWAICGLEAALHDGYYAARWLNAAESRCGSGWPDGAGSTGWGYRRS